MPVDPQGGRKESAPSSVTIFDCRALFELIDSLREQAHPADSAMSARAPTFDYGIAVERLRQHRRELGFARDQVAIGFATTDPASEAAKRFFTALEYKGIKVEAIDYRHATITAPLTSDSERADSRISTVSPSIAYALGLLAGRPSPEVVVVARCFDIYTPMMDLVRRGGKVSLAFFRRFLDARWGINGLFDPDHPIKFIDFDPISEELVGIDLREATKVRQHGGGLSDL